MKALVWHGKDDVRVDTVKDPELVDPTDVIIRITATAICGSDLHLLDGYQPTMEEGDVLGHEPMGVVVEVGKAVKKLKKGDRVVVPFIIACGKCFFCQKGLFAACEVSNPNGDMMAKVVGHRGAGAFGFSHLLGGFWGARPSTCAFHTPTWARRRSRATCRTRRSSSCPTSFPQAGWRRRTLTSSRATPWRSGAPVP